MLDRVFLCCCFLFSVNLYAEANTISLTDKSQIHITTYAEIFEDTSGALSFEEVSSGRYDFRPTPKDWKDYQGFTKSAFWLRINLLNQSKEPHWYISLRGGLNRKSEAYIRSGESDSFKPMNILPRSLGRVYTFDSEVNDFHTLYFRVQDLQLPLMLKLNLKSASRMLSQTFQDVPVYSVIFGGLFILALYNFFYFISLRDSGFLALSVFIAAFLLEMGGHMGLLHYFPSLKGILSSTGGFFVFVCIASAISLVCLLFEYKRYLPTIYKSARLCFWFSVGMAIISPFIQFSAAIAALFGSFLIIPALWSFRLAALAGFKFPTSTIFSGLVFLLGIMPGLLMAVGLLEINAQLSDLSLFTLLIALLLLSFTQAEKVRDKSQQAERTLASNQAKDEFLTTMSHELRTPMHAVVGAGSLLSLTNLSHEQKELVSRLDSSSKHMLSLINDVLDLSRAENNSVVLEKRPFKLDELLQSLDKLLTELAQSGGVELQLVNHFTPLNNQLIGDATRLRQVLLNLLSNAIKFTDQGSVKLIVTPENVGINQVRLCFEVIDTGIGISPDQQNSLFKPFTQAESSTSRKYGGSGLGLAISHRLVACMGGDLDLRSELGKGSHFFFTLDLGLQKSKGIISKEPVSSSQKNQSVFKALLVDDDEMNRFFGEKLLKACGVEAVVAEGGKQALECLQQQSFDLVFMDVSMPEMDGYETTANIRKNQKFADLIIVALTAHSLVGERQKCLNAGMNDFLTKPFELDSLKSTLDRWLPRPQLPHAESAVLD